MISRAARQRCTCRPRRTICLIVLVSCCPWWHQSTAISTTTLMSLSSCRTARTLIELTRFGPASMPPGRGKHDPARQPSLARPLGRPPQRHVWVPGNGVADQGHISGTGDLEPSSKFFSTGDVEKIVYVPTSAASKANEQVGKVGTVVDAGETMQLDQVVPRPREARGHSPDGRGRRHDAHAIPVGRPRGRDPPRGCPLLRRRQHRSRFVNDAAFPPEPLKPNDSRRYIRSAT